MEYYRGGVSDGHTAIEARTDVGLLERGGWVSGQDIIQFKTICLTKELTKPQSYPLIGVGEYRIC